MLIVAPTDILTPKQVRKYMVFPVVMPALQPCVPIEQVAGTTITLLTVQTGTAVVHHHAVSTATTAAPGAAVQPTLVVPAVAAVAVAEAVEEAHLLDHSPAVAVNNI